MMNEPKNPFDEMFEGVDPFDDPDGEEKAAPDEIRKEAALPSEDEAFDLGSEDDAENPFDKDTPDMPSEESETPQDATPSPRRKAATEEENETSASEKETGIPSEKEGAETAVADTDTQSPAAGTQTEFAQSSIYAKPPVFSHASANEPIEDATQTFDELRAAKAGDFPELEDGSRVSWEVRYGKIKKYVSVSDAKKKIILEIKSEIENAKEFVRDLKTSKDKNPTCFVTPRITAQSKGRIAAYKGVFTSTEEARASGKAICLVPGRDGLVYEIRRNETGEYITPVSGRTELSEIGAGFTPALPPVPLGRLLDIIAFFRSFMGEDGDYEAIANILWDRKTREYVVHVPKQRVTKTSATADLTSAPDPNRLLCYADVHSHNKMPALFSVRDDADEKAARVYAVLGRLDEPIPEISVRVFGGGKHFPIDPSIVFENPGRVCRTANAKPARESKGGTVA
jgi:hypothetical protein